MPVLESEADAVAADSGAKTGRDAADLVPGWLALLVLALLLAVAVLGGYLIRGAVARPQEEATRAQVASEQLEQEVKEDPNDPENLLELGYSYQEQGLFDQALAKYDEVLALEPKNTGALYNRGIALMNLKRWKEAEVALWDVLEVAPDHALAAKALGEYYVGKKQYKSALMTLEPVIKLQPQYADLQYLAGYSCEQLGISETAIAYYRGALTYDPNYKEAKDGLARLGATEQAQ